MAPIKNTPQVKCPACGRKQPGRGQFDNEPEDGGDYSDQNPAARLERAERAAQRKGKKRG